MEGIRTLPRSVLTALTVAGVLAAAIPVALACDTGTSPQSTHVEKASSEGRTAGEGKQPENRNNPARERCKRSDKSNVKGCPGEGGERVPQENKRSPLDDVPPLAPLVA
jgi:hypothetical protein